MGGKSSSQRASEPLVWSLAQEHAPRFPYLPVEPLRAALESYLAKTAERGFASL
jgi:hypothetical protein